MDLPTLELNWLAVIVAALAYFALGALWYGVFATPWMAAVGKTKEQIQADSRPYIYPLQMVATFLLVVLLAYWLVNVLGVGSDDLAAGLGGGLLLWAVAVLAGTGDFLYEARPLRLFLINSGYRLTGLLTSAAIVTLWQ